MVEGRTAGGQDAAAAEREVLTELGDPDTLAARYADRRLQLIGPTYYLAWERLLKLLLSFVPALVGVLVGLVEALDGGSGIGKGIVRRHQVAVQIAFWVTAGLRDPGTHQHPPGPARLDRRPTAGGHHRTGRSPGPTPPARSVFLVLLIAYLPLQHFRSFVPARRRRQPADPRSGAVELLAAAADRGAGRQHRPGDRQVPDRPLDLAAGRRRTRPSTWRSPCRWSG